jgi:CheY-like chemotaxis protein
MKLDELTPELFARALALYLERAYPDGNVPPRARVDVSALRAPADVLALFTQETRPNPGGEDVRHLVLRLGNHRYPHMKLALMEFLEPGEWMWSVDTHDRAPVDPASPDWEAWQELRIHNLKLKARIEAAWRRNGVPTARVVARKLGNVEERGDGPLVLVVDDERGLRSGAVNILRGEGYRVVEAESGLEAIDRFVQDRPDLVVLDYEMPGMSGEDVCRRLRDIEQAADAERHTPVLLATAGMVPLAEVCSADGFLVKPYQRTLLLSFVKHQLPGHKR